MIIDKKQAAELIRNSHGKFFRVEFVKRSDASHRIMLARTGVKKGVMGAGRKYDPNEHGLISVYDMHKASFRSISIEGICTLRINGNQYIVK